MTHRRAVALMILVTLLWSIAGVVTRHLDSAQGFETSFWRSLFNALSLAAMLSALRRRAPWSLLAGAPPVLWLSGGCWAVMFTTFMLAMTMTTVANVLITMALGPLFTALLARLVLGQRQPARTWLAIAVAGTGIASMFASDIEHANSLAGTLIALAVPVAAAINWILLQKVGTADPSQAPDMLPGVLAGALLASVATLPLAAPFAASGRDIALLGLLGAVQLAIPCLLVVRLARELPAPEIALLGLLEVVFGIAWAWIGAGEQPAASTLAGGALVILALLANEVLALRQLRHGAIQAPESTAAVPAAADRSRYRRRR